MLNRNFKNILKTILVSLLVVTTAICSFTACSNSATTETTETSSIVSETGTTSETTAKAEITNEAASKAEKSTKKETTTKKTTKKSKNKKETTARETTTEDPDDLVKVTCVRVVDGDTLVVKGDDDIEFKVRLIGVNTPESVSSDESKNCEEGKKASEYTKFLVKEDQTLYIVYDLQKSDKYDRDLAYVYMSNNIALENMLNYKLVKDGYAEVMTVEPNIAHKADFEYAQNYAKENSLGFWGTGYFS